MSALRNWRFTIFDLESETLGIADNLPVCHSERLYREESALGRRIPVEYERAVELAISDLANETRSKCSKR